MRFATLSLLIGFAGGDWWLRSWNCNCLRLEFRAEGVEHYADSFNQAGFFFPSSRVKTTRRGVARDVSLSFQLWILLQQTGQQTTWTTEGWRKSLERMLANQCMLQSRLPALKYPRLGPADEAATTTATSATPTTTTTTETETDDSGSRASDRFLHDAAVT